ISLTIRELLKVSLDIRKKIKESLNSKRVPVEGSKAATGSVEINSVSEINVVQEIPLPDLEEIVSAAHSLPLRIVYPIIHGLNKKLTCECILDPGAQIVAIDKTVWERLGLPLQSDHIMRMVNTNNSSNAVRQPSLRVNATMGLLEKVHFQFGLVSLYLQVQVVENAAFEVLLGRPFFALRQAQSEDSMEGEQKLALTDPNNHSKVTVVT
ncbi:hypothetical protein JAAARDRAFT_97390, partial [Jaapia argillacea MUCL 33604]